jgi:hypothetical protein
MSYPIYIFDEGQEDYLNVFPEGKEDLNHSDYWEATVARMVARYLKLPVEDLLNLPYCQRRARISGDTVYYGERQTKKLLKSIVKAVGEPGLKWGYDEHEQRLTYDCHDFAVLLSQ